MKWRWNWKFLSVTILQQALCVCGVFVRTRVHACEYGAQSIVSCHSPGVVYLVFCDSPPLAWSSLSILGWPDSESHWAPWISLLCSRIITTGHHMWLFYVASSPHTYTGRALPTELSPQSRIMLYCYRCFSICAYSEGWDIDRLSLRAHTPFSVWYQINHRDPESTKILIDLCGKRS